MFKELERKVGRVASLGISCWWNIKLKCTVRQTPQVRECSVCPQERQQQAQAPSLGGPGCFWVQVGLCWFGLISAADLTDQEKCGLGVSGKVVSGETTWAGLIEAEFCCQHGGECFSYFNWNDFL